MNSKVVIFSGLVTALVGVIIGLGAAEISQNEYVSRHYDNLPLKFALVGAGVGAIAGAGQEAVREIKAQQDKEQGGGSFLSHHH
ncbi:MAG: hypothetical protein HC922_02280 [Leptolyngbyaceae cyanobacterium SM2_3_12]|nr:hypothetical protein [Leptolyngbyaceae cyanobacterium SM2_3_12]